MGVIEGSPSLEHLEGQTSSLAFPGGTYAYTTSGLQIYAMDKPVSIDYFWLRLHRASNLYTKNEMDFRHVQVFLGNELVADQTLMLVSDEWYLVRPTYGELIGDRLVIDTGTDLDGFSMTWGQVIPHSLAIQKARNTIATFTPF